MSDLSLPMPLDLSTVFDTPPPPLDYILPGFLAGTLGGMVSPGGTGKSMAALEIAIQIAVGVDLLGFGPVPTGPAVYLGLEDPEIIIRHRLHAMGAYLSADARSSIAERVRTYTAEQLGRIDLMRDRDADRLCGIAQDARIVIIDTLRRIHSADENDSGAMCHVTDTLERVCRSTGTTILFLHHTSKTAAMSGAGDMQQAARGSSVITDHARYQLNLVGMSEREAEKRGIDEGDRRYYVRLVTPKPNYGRPMPDRWLRREAGGVLRPVDVPTEEERKAKRQAARAYAVASGKGGGDDW